MNNGNWLDIGTWGNAAGWAILHSLWQIGLIALLTRILLHYISPKKSELRYALLLFSMLLTTFWVGLTFFHFQAEHALLRQIDAVGTAQTGQFSPAPEAAPLLVAATFWDQCRQFVNGLDRFMPLVANSWLLGILLFSLYLLFGLSYLKYLQFRRVAMPTSDWQARFAALCRQMEVKIKIDLRLSEIVDEPLTFRFFRPVILLPAAIFTGLTPDQVEVLLLHELAHIRRHDFMVNLLQTLLEVLFFYHPAIWWLSARIREEREHCCDDAVLEVRNQPVLYATALTQIQLHHSSIKKSLAMSAIGNKSALTKRVYRLFGRYDQQTSRFRSIAIFLLLLLVSFSVQSFLISKNTNTPEEQATVITSLPIATASVVSGKVFDEAKNPIIGAAILIKDTNIGTVSDMEGAFSIKLPSECATLVLQYVGMEKKEIENSCGGDVLEVELKKIESQVVTVQGYPMAPAKQELPATGKIIEGKVRDADNNPLIGVNIIIKGTTTGTITDFHGQFKLQLPEDCATILMSYIGMKTRELPNSCAGQTLDVVLEKVAANALSEQVVVIGKPVNPADMIKGTVADKDGNPLIGALILIKDTSIGTITDMEGVFALLPSDKCATLIFRYVGMEEKVIENACAGDQLEVNLLPKESAPLGDQAVNPENAVFNKFEVYPNPSQGQVNVTFQLAKAGRVKFSVFSAEGKLVDKIADQDMDAGPQQLQWKAPEGRKGNFMLLLESGGGFSRKQIVIE